MDSLASQSGGSLKKPPLEDMKRLFRRRKTHNDQIDFPIDFQFEMESETLRYTHTYKGRVKKQ